MELPFEEGTWFAVPLEQGGYATGLVARHTPEGEIILAYLFGPRWENVPALDDIKDSKPKDAVKVAKVSYLGLLDGTWPLIGNSPSWERNKWPIPNYIRRDELTRTAWRVTYSNDDPNLVVSEERIPYETADFERDSLLGSVAAEIIMSQLLAEDSTT